MMLVTRQQDGTGPGLPVLRLGRDVCANPALAEATEWLVTNGLGGYTSGTVSGQPTRDYHGVLVATLEPPVGRTVMLAALAESLSRWAARAGGSLVARLRPRAGASPRP